MPCPRGRLDFDMKNKISLAGDLGSGKSTVANILIDELHAEYYSTGAIVRSIAAKRGMSVVELNIYMETHPEIDNEIDDGLVALSDKPEALIIDSRMAWHFTKGTFKVYLSTDAEVSALRIMGANRIGEHAASLEDTVRETRARRESEKKRYFEQYGVNIKDLFNYSLIVDTTYASPDAVAECILKGFRRWQEDPEYTEAFICPERLHYPDDEPNSAEVERLAAALEQGSPITEISVVEKNGEFFLSDGHEAALAYTLAMRDYIPARLVKCDISENNYVKMTNSL